MLKRRKYSPEDKFKTRRKQDMGFIDIFLPIQYNKVTMREKRHLYDALFAYDKRSRHEVSQAVSVGAGPESSGQGSALRCDKGGYETC